MKKILYIIFLAGVLLIQTFDAQAFLWKKKKVSEDTTKVTKTRYEKFFDGKTVETSKGLMTMHKIKNKVYVEFPTHLLNKEMLLSSSIVNSSDNGEGIIGQFAGEPRTFIFTKNDTIINARMVVLQKVRNSTEDNNVNERLTQSNMPGIYTSFSILATTPDSTAYLIDVTPFFLEHSLLTNPLSGYAANSKWGFVYRDHKYKAERSHLNQIKSSENGISVISTMGYDVDYIIIGMYQGGTDIKFSATINKMLTLLPEKPMQPRIADSRIGVSFFPVSHFENENKGLETVYYTKRWRLEPENPIDYANGILVEPKKPIIFYIDSLMPDAWKGYVQQGVNEWGKAFEAIGFKNAIMTKEFPKDSTFDATDISNSVILYSPTAEWMYKEQNSMHYDIRTGEILNASIYIHHNLLSTLYRTRVVATMASDPDVRYCNLPDSIMGDMLKNFITRQVGTCLGLTSNYRASSVYPVDSLRSPAFTQKYGLSPSIMDDVPCNFVAQSEDVKKGVRLTTTGIGEYDYYAIKWLYKPIPNVTKPQDELATLDKWIKDSFKNPYLQYGRNPFIIENFDPTILTGDLGDDPVKAFNYRLANLKISFENFYRWFDDDDKNLNLRSFIYNVLAANFTSNAISNLGASIGGFYVNEIHANDDIINYEIVPKHKQKEVIKTLVNLGKDLSWLDDKNYMYEMTLRLSFADDFRNAVVKALFSRLPMVILSAEKSKGGYQPQEYMDELYNMVWEGTIKRKMLSKNERDLQLAFLAAVMKTSTIADDAKTIEPANPAALHFTDIEMVNQYVQNISNSGSETNFDIDEYSGFYSRYSLAYKKIPQAHLYYNMLLKIENLLKATAPNSRGENKLHYEYMLFKIKQAKNINS